MTKKILCIFICLIILITILPSSSLSLNKITIDPITYYTPEDIDIRDASYHKSTDGFRGEWWYFEGIFDNGYSIIIDISIFSNSWIGIVALRMSIFNEGKEEFYKKDFYALKELDASEVFPLVRISGNHIMSLDREIYNSTGVWLYTVTIDLDGQEANLKFTGTTKGYKGEVLRGWYGPVLPKADVEGTLILNGEEINVIGLGYHEHAWDLRMPIIEWGWYWGKIVSESYCVFWTKMLQTRFSIQQYYSILNQDNSGFVHINPNCVDYKVTDFIINNRRIIPTKFVLTVNDPSNLIYINATLNATDIEHIGLGLIRYWRYHVIVNGEITYGQNTEKIEDKVQIIELRRFR